jgi:Family of unknown function (DUF6261)
MNIKTKANRVGTVSLAALGERIISTVVKSGIDEAQSSKQFLVMQEVNGRYQAAIVPDEQKELSDRIKDLFISRRTFFDDIFEYVKGQTKSPSPDVRDAALRVFSQLNKYGRSYSRVLIADQSVQYIRVIEGLKRSDIAPAVNKLLLTAKVAQFDQLQRDYEDLYLNRGDTSKARVAPSSLRKEMQNAVKMYVEELKWLTNTNDTAEWNTLYQNIEQRFSELTVKTSHKKAAKPAANASTTETKSADTAVVE